MWMCAKMGCLEAFQACTDHAHAHEGFSSWGGLDSIFIARAGTLEGNQSIGNVKEAATIQAISREV